MGSAELADVGSQGVQASVGLSCVDAQLAAPVGAALGGAGWTVSPAPSVGLSGGGP